MFRFRDIYIYVRKDLGLEAESDNIIYCKKEKWKISTMLKCQGS